MTNPPFAPTAPIKDLSLSTKTSIAFTWQSVADNVGETGGRVTGYRVYMAKDSDGAFVLVKDAKELRTLTAYIAQNLDTGRLYRFKVSAYNFNGEGPTSDPMTTYSCIAPLKMQAPTRITSTSAPTFTIEWKAPEDDGGCPITGYAVFRNDGEGGATITEVNSVLDTNIRDQPTLR